MRNWRSEVRILPSRPESEKMTEFRNGIVNTIKNLMLKGSFTLAIIYTLGHICIAMTVVYMLTGSSVWEAGLVALIEPSINGVWFYILHKTWTYFRQ